MENRFNLPDAELDRIKKILALAHGTSNPNEAAVAAQMAAKILLQYNLELAQVELFLSEEDRREISQVMLRGCPLPDGVCTDWNWIVILHYAVAEASLCKPLICGDQIVMLGRKTDADTALLIFNDLLRQMLGMVEIAAKEHNQNFKNFTGKSYWDSRPSTYGNPNKVKRDWKKSWLYGCAQGIATAMKQEKDSFAGNSAGMALVVTREVEISKFMENMEVTHKKSRSSTVYTNAKAQGYSTGIQLGATAGKPKLSD